MFVNQTGVMGVLRAFAGEIKEIPEILYITALGLYILSRMSRKVQWVSISVFSGLRLQQALTFSAIIFAGIITAFILARWTHKVWAAVSPAVLVIGFLFLCARKRPDIFDGVMVVFFVILSYRKRFHNIVKLYLGCAAGVLIVVALGLLIGFTKETPKVGPYGTGYAFGTIHPNIWGCLVFLVLVAVWFLYLQKRDFLLFFISWPLGVFMVLVPKCRTQALLFFVFPVFIYLMDKLMVDGENRRFLKLRFLCKWILILTPFLCFGITVFLGNQREWLVEHTFGLYIENFSKRFIQSGIAFHEHGFPMFGQPLHLNMGVHEVLGNYDIPLYVMDNAYSTYAILRGMLWIVLILVWLCYANWKSLKEKEYGILVISVFMSVFALMERYGLDVWYNFVLLSPFASMCHQNKQEHNRGD